MKRLLLFFLMLCLCVCFCSCSNNDPIDQDIDHGDLITYGECNDNIKWEIYEDGFLSISGKGKVMETPWLNYTEYIKSVNIDNDILSIPESVFLSCANIEVVKIGTSVAELPASAFEGCVSLVEIELPDALKSIGDNCFERCHALKNITIPNSVTSIGTYAFSECTSLAKIEIPEMVTIIPESAFYDCTSLHSVTIPSVTGIHTLAFSGCSNLEDITLPGTLVGIGPWEFSKCSSIKSISIPAGVTAIQRGIFNECDSLEYVSINGQVTEIEEYAFYSCNIQEIHLPGSVKTIYPRAFIGGYTVDTVYWAGNAMPSIVYPYLGHRYGEEVWMYDRTVDLYHLFENAQIKFNGANYTEYTPTEHIPIDEDSTDYSPIEKDPSKTALLLSITSTRETDQRTYEYNDKGLLVLETCQEPWQTTQYFYTDDYVLKSHKRASTYDGRQVTSYETTTYDEYGSPTKIEGTFETWEYSYAYDLDGAILSVKVHYTSVDGNNLEQEFDFSKDRAKFFCDYNSLSGSLGLKVTRNKQTVEKYRFLQDGNSIALYKVGYEVLDNHGNPISSIEYFGILRGDGGWTVESKYTNHYDDAGYLISRTIDTGNQEIEQQFLYRE